MNIALKHLARYELLEEGENTFVLIPEGPLDLEHLESLRSSILEKLSSVIPKSLRVEGSKIERCDSAGISFLLELQEWAEQNSVSFQIKNLSAKHQDLLELYQASESKATPENERHLGLIASLGRAGWKILTDLHHLISFVGELSVELGRSLTQPKRIRWKEVYLVIEKSGVESLPIIVMIGFLIGLIMSFQAAIPMKQFGADIFIADLVALSLLRELGPLMTAILLAGRSGSAFAAEIGTMKVNEEINALNTMGINPVKFLVTNKVLGVILLTPVLTLFMELAGLVGGSVVFTSLGYPLVTYINKVVSIIHLYDFLGGMAKSFAFGLLVAAIGCLRGLETKTGASAVGDSATNAVVSGIILIVLADGVFSVLFYFLGI